MGWNICPDDLAWEQAEAVSNTWLLRFLEHDILRPIADFILQHNRGNATEFAILKKGSYNISLRLKYRINATVIRFSQPGAVLFPEEKVANEVAVMRFLIDQTSIPIPFILHSGTKQESPLRLSPFIMMDYIEHETKLYNALNRPDCPKEERGVLDPNINDDRLGMLYGQMAGILLQLFAPSLPRIGSVSQIDDFTWEVSRRPLSMDMNELVRVGGMARSNFPSLATTFDTTSSYFETLADLNMAHLLYQRNDAVDSADDCRRKFVARRLFCKLTREKRLHIPKFNNGPFRLWRDDFRPANVLLNENSQIVGVVDWEFTYAAPIEFSYAPPWWLLIERPESWPKGLDDWAEVFDRRLKLFLEVMKGREDTAIRQGRLQEEQRLSDHMQQSWESGDFWIMYAVKNSFAFDEVYWRKIDPRFFGATTNPKRTWEERLILLDEEGTRGMEQLVARKVDEMTDRRLEWDPDEYTAEVWEQLKRQRGEASEGIERS